MTNIAELKKIASQVRRDIIRQVFHCQSGHPGGSLGCADLLTALYFRVMKMKELFDMSGKDEDVFYLSNGHISPVWYSVLARKGFFRLEELYSFRKINSRLQGHPTTHEGLPGVRVASGSLGQGLSVAIGHALGKKLENDPSLVYVLMGDGELQEGQVWEAAMFGAHHKVDNLIAMVDYNGRQIDGDTKDVMNLGDLRKKWESFGWMVFETPGNDMDILVKNLEEYIENKGNKKPIIILVKTEMGYPIDFMMGSHKWHGIAPNEEQTMQALAQLPETLGDF